MNVQVGLEATGIGRDQYLLKMPASYHGQAVVSIGFDFCSTAALRWLILPTSIQKITALAFFKNAPEIIFYEGTAEEFARVSIGSMNDALSNTTVCYYSEQIPPNDGGNYWCYAENGAPCVWEIFTEESAQP